MDPHGRHFDRIMQRFLPGSLFQLPHRDTWKPAVDVYELEEEFHVVVELAGVARDRVEVIFEGTHLTIRGWREDPAPRKRLRLHQMEIDHGPFECVVRVDATIDRARLEAFYRDGFLRVRLPKVADAEPRTVEINVAPEDDS
jgi:HSP20 family protein